MWKPGTRPPSSFAMRLAESAGRRETGMRADSGVQPASRRMPSVAPTALEPLEPGPVDAPPPLRALVERALAKRAEDRFQDARALLGAIRALETTAAEPPRSAGES